MDIIKNLGDLEELILMMKKHKLNSIRIGELGIVLPPIDDGLEDLLKQNPLKFEDDETEV
jgi:hypothetical protein